jgi:hypothetical protein
MSAVTLLESEPRPLDIQPDQDLDTAKETVVLAHDPSVVGDAHSDDQSNTPESPPIAAADDAAVGSQHVGQDGLSIAKASVEPSKDDATDGSDPLPRVASRKRPHESSSLPVRPLRKRQYVSSVRTVDGIRRHVTVSCMRLATGGFKCTFTSEHRRLDGTLKSQRANAKGGDVVERRHDAFLVPGPADFDAPFPDYDWVLENFLSRGTDICAHVGSELIPAYSKAPLPAGSPCASNSTPLSS